MYVGNSENMRQTLKVSEYNQWLELNSLNDAHRSNYTFNSPTGLVHPYYAEVKHIWVDCDTMLKRPDRILNDYFEDKGDIKRAFISSGNNFHLLLGIEQIPAKYATISINTFISILQIETEIQFDPVSSDLLHLRRSVGSINPKNGEMACYYDPTTFETSLKPIILGENNLEINVVKTDIKQYWTNLKKKKRFKSNRGLGMVDPYDLNIRLPSDMGHFSRIGVLRKLRNGGVSKKRALEYVRSWLTPIKYGKMIDEGVINRIYNYRL